MHRLCSGSRKAVDTLWQKQWKITDSSTPFVEFFTNMCIKVFSFPSFLRNFCAVVSTGFFPFFSLFSAGFFAVSTIPITTTTSYIYLNNVIGGGKKRYEI